jgi:hypothetical protein
MAIVFLLAALIVVSAFLRRIIRQQEEANVKLAELLQALTDLHAQIEKAKIEIITKITELETALADVDLPADAQAKLDELKIVAQSLDDIVPDQP